MKGAKRFAASESNPAMNNDSVFRNKRVLMGPTFDAQKTDSSQPQSIVMPTLDVQRAESSRQHVRALNSQFASWVQTQLKNHSDELWEDGIRDYLAHASNIMEKFNDVVNWLKANAAKGETVPAADSQNPEKKTIPEIKSNDTIKSFQGQAGNSPLSTTTTSSTTSWSSSGTFSNNQSSLGTVTNSQTSGVFSSSQSSGMFSSSPSFGIFSAGSSSSGVSSNSQSLGVFSFNSQTSGLFSHSQSTGFSFNSQTSGLFSNSQSSGLPSNSNSPGFLFSNSQSSFMFANQSSVPAINHDASNNEDNENEEQPSSPSVKKSEEKDIVVVHEVKCKLYVKSSDPADKDPWKDKGTGQLAIKCKEGFAKATKDSKPTVIIRNDVGKILLNALLYPGIKTNTQKNSIVAIFHTTGDDGNDIVARTFLIRLKTEDDRNKLASAIQDYAPSS